jgi:competence ComEA-like helix-hairpin-helix protein
MNISNIIKDYFSFNRKEQRGLFVLILILTGLTLADVFISDVLPQKQVDFSDFEKDVIEIEKEIKLRDSLEKMEKEKRFRNKYYNFPGSRTDSAKNSRSPGRESFVIELNAADTFELQRLRGIGSSFANRIVKYRERLGGYIDKSQLLEVFGMDAERYKSIKDQVTVNPDSIRKIDLNGITFKELLRHPYFPFEVTKNVMIYRKEHKKFNDKEELLKIKIIDDSVFKKIEPYIKIQ